MMREQRFSKEFISVCRNITYLTPRALMLEYGRIALTIKSLQEKHGGNKELPLI